MPAERRIRFYERLRQAIVDGAQEAETIAKGLERFTDEEVDELMKPFRDNHQQLLSTIHHHIETERRKLGDAEGS